MWYKPYGRTGKEISVVGFGGMRFDNPEDIDANAEIVLYAHSKGINYFDTAPGYDAGKSEQIFGEAFRQMPGDSFYCSTKSSKADGGALRADLETSLRRMNVEKIDFFHIWCIVKAQQWSERKDGGAIAAAIKAKEEGLVGHVAASLHLSGQKICEIVREGLLEATFWARHVPRYRSTYERVQQKRGPKIARVVVARMLLRSIYKMLRDRVRFDRLRVA